MLFIACLVRFSNVFCVFYRFFRYFCTCFAFQSTIPVLFSCQFNDKHFVSQKMSHVKLFSPVMRLFYIFNRNHLHFIRILVIYLLFISVLSCFLLYFTYFRSFFTVFPRFSCFFSDIHAAFK